MITLELSIIWFVKHCLEHKETLIVWQIIPMNPFWNIGILQSIAVLRFIQLQIEFVSLEWFCCKFVYWNYSLFPYSICHIPIPVYIYVAEECVYMNDYGCTMGYIRVERCVNFNSTYLERFYCLIHWLSNLDILYFMR